MVVLYSNLETCPTESGDLLMSYSLNEEAKAFSYTREELFNCITRIVAHPHKVITDHDKSRALAIFLTFSDYLGNYTESDNTNGHYVYESENTDFEGFVLKMINDPKLNYGDVTSDEILK
jgi:hypothetical protein